MLPEYFTIDPILMNAASIIPDGQPATRDIVNVIRVFLDAYNSPAQCGAQAKWLLHQTFWYALSS